MAGVTKAGSTDKSSGTQTSQKMIEQVSPEELAMRSRFQSLGMSQADAVQDVLNSLHGKLAGNAGIGSIGLSAGDQQALDAAYAGSEQNLRRFGQLLGQDMAGTRGLNTSDTPVTEAVLRETLPAMATLQSNKAQHGLNLGMGMKQFQEGMRQFNIGGALSGAQTQPLAGLSLMNSLQGERFERGQTVGTQNQSYSPSWLNRLLTVTEGFKNVGQGMAGFKSDERLKRNIRPVSWQWKADEHGEYLGVIAQDIQRSHPHLVSQHPDGYFMVDYGAMVAMLLSEREWLYGQLTEAGTADTCHPSPMDTPVGASVSERHETLCHAQS